MAISLKMSSQRGRRRSGASPFSDINVTPMVDVMLVLLIVFMITAPLLSVGVPVDLPKTKAAKMNDQVEPLVITVDASGKSYLQEMELSGDALIARLMAVTNSNPEAKIYVRGDQKIAYGRIMEIMGTIAASGFTKVSLLAELPVSGKTPQVAAQTASVQAQKAPISGPAAAGLQRLPSTPPVVAPVPQKKPVTAPQIKPAVVPAKQQRS